MLLILLLALTLIFAAVLWIGTVIVQGWLYNDLAKYLPVRALIGGAILAFSTWLGAPFIKRTPDASTR